jgi:fucose permease
VEVLLALAFVATRPLWRTHALAADGGVDVALMQPPPRAALWASVALFYCYGGLEAGTGLWATSLLADTRHVSLASAGAAVSVYWGALCAGRFVCGAWADRIGPQRVLTATVWAALLAVVALAWPNTPAWFVGLALAALGLALAPIYPLAMHDTPRRFQGPAGARLVGQQVAATAIGVASLPWLLGVFAARVSLLWLPGMLTVLSAAVVLCERARRRV